VPSRWDARGKRRTAQWNSGNEVRKVNKITMRKIVSILSIFALIASSCGNKIKNNVNKTLSDTILTPEIPTEEIKFEKLHKLFVVGNFDDNGIDTLFLHHYSKLTKAEIDSFPYPNGLDDWGDFIKCFYDQEIESYVALSKKNKDTLHLGSAIGLHCLINIGDNNFDGKDEIALVVDYLDFSRVNSCKIYTLCNNKWTLLKQFDIHEDAFDYNYLNNELPIPPVFSEIKEYLEKHDGKWFYLDYQNDDWDRMEDVGKMKRLKLGKCK
jgi:hypothetical protein